MRRTKRGQHVIRISFLPVNKPLQPNECKWNEEAPCCLLCNHDTRFPPASPRWSGPPGAGFRLHLRDGVPHQGRERVPEPAARRPQRAAHAEKHAAGDKVSLMDRLIGPPALPVFMWCHRTCEACHARRCTGGNELMLCIAPYKKSAGTSQFMVYGDIFPTHLLKVVCNLLVRRLAPLFFLLPKEC